MKTIHEKLRSQRGMTLTEVLVALIILSLVTVGIATGVGASLRVYRQATEASDAQMLASTLSTALMDELRYARDISGTTDPTFTSGTFGENVFFDVDNDGYVVVKTVGNDSEPPKLLSSAVYAKLQIRTAKVTYNSGVFQVALTIRSGTEDRDVRTESFAVRALNAQPAA